MPVQIWLSNVDRVGKGGVTKTPAVSTSSQSISSSLTTPVNISFSLVDITVYAIGSPCPGDSSVHQSLADSRVHATGPGDSPGTPGTSTAIHEGLSLPFILEKTI